MSVNKKLKNHILWGDDAIVIDTKNSLGSMLVDKETKKEYVDCFSQFASQPLGWNHPKVLSQKDRLADVAVHKIANSDMGTTEFADFVETFSAITPDFKYHFFIDGGGLAVENALKAAFDWKYQLDEIPNMNVVYLEEAFHGRTGYTMSMTNNPYSDLKTKWFPKFNWSKLHNPKISFPMNEKEIVNDENAALHDLELILQDNDTAAVIYEPIQGEGGDNHFRSEFFKRTKELTEKYNSLFILDEVQTGVGLTGKMWAYEHFDVIPDIICFGKKAQVCGISCGEKIDQVKDNVFHMPSRINSTWGGNIVDMVRSSIYIEIIQEDDLVNNAKVVGDYFLDKLQKLGLSNARGRGLMIAYDMKNPAERDLHLDKLSENVLALPCGRKSIRFRPHLTFTKEDVDVVIDHINAC